MHGRTLVAAGLSLYLLGLVSVSAQRAGTFKGKVADDPAINYSTAALNNAVEDVNRKLQSGAVQLAYEGRGGFLRSALDALEIPVDSQLLVFSKASLQGKQIDEQSPRALYFNDRVALGWVRDGSIIEVAAHDESAGVVFYTLDQRADAPSPPQFKRVFLCLGCHKSGDTLNVPGLLMFSTSRPSQSDELTLPRFVDQTDELDRRFGGWFVTGVTGASQHLGNDVAALHGRSRDLTTVDGLFDPDGYRASSSDVVSHLVFTHQVAMTNLLTRASWQARALDPALHPQFTPTPGEEARVALMMDGVAKEVVDYMLFVDEAPLAQPVRGQSGFAERFSTIGPRDRKGRTLHELDLTRRLMKYPCSYLIYAPAFDALPPGAKGPIYQRLWAVLSGSERDERYRSLLLTDRQAIVEILRDTKKDLPPYFQQPVTK